MDPNEVLEIMVEAAVNGDVEIMTAAAEDLKHWIQSGGFPPQPSAAYRSALRLGYNPL
jgi:hypothetical protein